MSTLRLQHRDRRLLVDLYLQRALTRDQILCLGHFHSVPRCNNRLAKLVNAGLVRKVTLPSQSLNSQRIYAATPLAASEISLALALEVAEVREALRRDAPLFLAHTLGLTDLRIRVVREAAGRGVIVSDWLPEPLCRHEYSVRVGGTWQRAVLKPDAYLQLESGDKVLAAFVELDLGHVGYTPFRRMLEGYVSYHDLELFEEIYGLREFMVLVVTTTERRLDGLSRLGQDLKLNVLYTTLVRLERVSFFGPVWTAQGKIMALLGSLS